MKHHLFLISSSFLFFPLRYVENNKYEFFEKERTRVVSSVTNDDNADHLYNELQLSDLGLSRRAFDYAYKGYQYLSKKKKLSNPSILTICDFSQSSSKKRFYVLDLANDKVLMNTYVAHGKGSGVEYASRFSNNGRSHQSSLGFYITGQTYYGEHGLSLRLMGLEAGFNDRATRRNIVMHGAGYIGDEYLQTNKFMGRSFGCPAIPQNECNDIIDLVKNGTCLFIYYPAKRYLQRSKILNG